MDSTQCREYLGGAASVTYDSEMGVSRMPRITSGGFESTLKTHHKVPFGQWEDYSRVVQTDWNAFPSNHSPA